LLNGNIFAFMLDGVSIQLSKLRIFLLISISKLKKKD